MERLRRAIDRLHAEAEALQVRARLAERTNDQLQATLAEARRIVEDVDPFDDGWADLLRADLRAALSIVTPPPTEEPK